MGRALHSSDGYPPSPSSSGTAIWAWAVGGGAVVAVGVLAALLAAGPAARQVLAGGATAAVAGLGCLAVLWASRRELRRLAALDTAVARFAELVATTSVEEALAAAVDVVLADGRLVAVALSEDAVVRTGLTGVVVADALTTGRPAVVPDGTTGNEHARLLALPVVHGERCVGAAVLRLRGPVDGSVEEVQHLLARVAPVLAAAGGDAGTGTRPARERGHEGDVADVADVADEEDLRALIARGSHDLRTPLNTLAGMVDTLVRHGEEMPVSARQELYEALQRSARRIAGWITVLLDAATDPTTRTSRPVPTPLQPLLEEAATVSHAATAGLEVDVRPTDLHVVADPSGVVRAVSNLLANAGHHAHDGGAVEVEACVRGDDVEVSVRDHGSGWDKDPGSGTDRAAAKQNHHAGLGLGLASVRAQVAEWGGQLELAETPGGGATVRFTLPRAVRLPGDDHGWTIAGGESLLQGGRRRVR